MEKRKQQTLTSESKKGMCDIGTPRFGEYRMIITEIRLRIGNGVKAIQLIYDNDENSPILGNKDRNDVEEKKMYLEEEEYIVEISGEMGEYSRAREISPYLQTTDYATQNIICNIEISTNRGRCISGGVSSICSNLVPFSIKFGEDIEIFAIDGEYKEYLTWIYVPVIRKKNPYVSNIEGPYWMSLLSDNVLISDINIPGTHDSAAIMAHFYQTVWDCQKISILEQLYGGVRLLDVRLKVKPTERCDVVEFVACHGNNPIQRADKYWEYLGIINEFQSLESLMEECDFFLKKNPTEMIAMIISIEDIVYSLKPIVPMNQIYAQLSAILNRYNIYSSQTTEVPCLKDVRGKIYLITKNMDLNIGRKVSWKAATPYLCRDGFTIQDQWENIRPECLERFYPSMILATNGEFGGTIEELIKTKLVLQVADRKDNTILLNFATGTKNKGFGVYIGKILFDYITKQKRQQVFGWILFDFPFEEDFEVGINDKMNIIQLIIDSNFKYKKYDALKNSSLRKPQLRKFQKLFSDDEREEEKNGDL